MQTLQNTTPIIPQLFMSSTDAVTTKTVGGPISLADLLHCLSGGHSSVKSKVEALRNLVEISADKDQILRVKKSLPAVYPHILFKKKGSLKAGNSDFDLTGLVHVDIDGKSSSDAVWIKNKLMGMSPTPLLAFLSPSGTGVKCIFATDLAKIHDGSSEAIGGSAETKKHNFKRGWSFLKDKVNATLETRFMVDTAPSSTNSTFFCSYDPNFYLNLDALQTPIELDSTPDIKFRKTKSPSNSSMTEPTLTTSTNASANSASTPKLKKMGLAHMCADAPKVLQSIDKIIGTALPAALRKKAESAVRSYLEAPIGMGKRHAAFFTAAVHLAHCGLSKSMIADVLGVLDYDSSRDPDDVMGQLEKYGLLNKKVQSIAPIDAIKSHLSDLMTVDKTILVDQWLSDAKDELLDVLHSHKITMLDASTGIGKTRFCMETLPSLWGGRIFFACPTTVLRDQIAYTVTSPDIQFLEAEHELSPTAKVVVTTYEKLVYTRKDWSSNDLVIIDECHLMELGFRQFASKFLMQEAVEGQTKFLVMSATGQGLGCTLKGFVGDQVCVLKARKKQAKDLSIEIKICKSPLDRMIDAVKTELARDPQSKILVYRNSLDDLDEIAKIIGPDAIVLSAETKNDPKIKGIFNGIEPQERVILCSSLVEIGVNLPSLTKIFVCSGSGPSIQVANLVQVSDRARRPVGVTWFVSKSIGSTQRLGHYGEEFLKKYKEIVDAWVGVESLRLPLALGKAKSKNFQEVKKYIKAVDESLGEHRAGSSEFPVAGCLFARTDGMLSWGVQGVLENVADMERLAESSLYYKIAKLETVFGAKITVSTCADKANPKAQEDSVWQRLAGMKFDFDADDLNFQISQAILSLQLRKKREKDLELNLFKRIFTLHQAGLDLESYVFLAEKDWEELMHILSIKANPHLHPLERAWADEIENLGKLELFADDVKDALSACKLAPQDTHLREKLMELPSQVLSRIVSTFFKVDHGKKINPSTRVQGRYLKVLDVRPIWQQLVLRRPKPIPPPLLDPNFPF